MTLKEAEEYYKKYDGHGFHMYREEPEIYQVFQDLHIPNTRTKQWDSELTEDYFKKMWMDPDRVWTIHDRLIDILIRSKNKAYIDRLLCEMEKMESLSKKNKVLIIENMAGRNAALEGGCMLVCRNTDYGIRMDRIMKRIMDFSCDERDNIEIPGWHDMRARYENAVSQYKSAYLKWGRTFITFR